ncbi:HAD family hydrolase [Sphingomonas jinjuensis]|nr:HAD family hydrolase [Sphingomonas jinjuensis]
MHVALGGCLKSPPISFGLTADTGGHISYVLEAAAHQAALPDVDQVTIVTRLFHAPHLGDAYAVAHEPITAKLDIRRLATARPDYCEKEALAAELPAFTDALCDYLARLPRRPDVVHAHFADAAAVAAAVQRRFGIPFVFTPHALGIDKRSQQLAGDSLDARIVAERAAIVGAAAVLVSTDDEAQRQVGGYAVPLGTRVHVVSPGVPRRDLVPTAPTLVDELATWLDHPERPIILAVARPVAKKNLAALVRSYAAHDGLRRAANLVILAGQHAHASPDEAAILAELSALAATPALQGRVALPPSHDVGDVAALYALAARGGVFVNPALHEPFGLTLIEAAAAGVPVVATRHGGAADIVGTIGHGTLVDPRDEPAIGAAVFAILNDPSHHDRLQRAARRGARLYCWDRYARSSVALYGAAATPRFLASDIDNTLTGCREGAAAFAEWRRRSSQPFIVATGRGIDAARLILNRWRLPMPDAFVTDVGTTLSLPDGKGGWSIDEAYARSLDTGWDRDGVAAVLDTLDLASQPPVTEGPHKISFFGDAAHAARIRSALTHAGLQARVVFSHGRLIDVLAPSGGKASAIAAFAARHGWTLADAVAAGDSGNDHDMLAACGHAILVGNASDELASLPSRAGLYRARRHHAGGVVEGLAALGLDLPKAAAGARSVAAAA